MADERARAIDLAMSQIEKQFGKGSIMRLGSKEAIVPISVIPTGALSFDAALGVGGFPRGRVVEVFGPESSGKTTIALQVIAEAQKAGGMAAFVDAEHALDPGYAKKLGAKGAIVPISVISTGAISFDAALGVGGVPRGRVVEIFGPESSGKTTITLQIIAEAQKAGGMAAFVDAEHALDPIYAQKLGVDVDNLLVSQPDYGEQALEITEALVRSGAIDVLVVDSVAALVPKAELDGEMGDSHVGLQARLMSQALRKLTGTVSKSRTCLIFINQIREKIGVMFGNPETTTGGRALKFYSSVRIDIRRIAAIKDGDIVIGSRTKVKVVKNKTAAPFREAEFDIMYGEGISKEGDMLDIAVEANIVEKSGAWYSYKGERIGQGRENAKQFLKENKDIAAKVEAEVRKSVGLVAPSERAAQQTQAAAAPGNGTQAAPPARPERPVPAKK